MTTKGNGATATDLLDRVLLGKSDETKARVLELVLRLGISPQDELFLVMIALNHLQVLVEDAPQDWKALFENFSGELNQWTDTNLDVLNSLVTKAEHEKTLAENSKLLVSSLHVLTTTSTELLTYLQKQSQTSNETTWLQSYLSNALREQENTIQQHLKRISSSLKFISQKSSASPALPSWLVVLLILLTASSSINTWLLLQRH
jgi:hypothetical protein